MENLKSDKLSFEAPSGKIQASLMSAQNSAGELAVVLPGAGYPCTMPLLYYSIDALLLKGYQVLAVEKVYADDLTWRGIKNRGSAFAYVQADTVELFTQISKQFSNQVKVLLGRSLGTFQIACALEEKLAHPRQVVWQTPALGEKWPVIQNCGILGFGIIGTIDPRYETAIPYFPPDQIVIEGADHAMEIPGDIPKSIAILQQVIQATDNWIMPATRV